ncbi:MAG: hypothetical protein WBB69_13410 [Anaerolineales bacterium]
MMNGNNKTGKIILSAIILLIAVQPIRGSGVDSSLQMEQIRTFSRPYEFDYASWTLSAVVRKISQASLKADKYISGPEGRQLVLDYLDLRNRADKLLWDLTNVISDPYQEDPEGTAALIKADLDKNRIHREALAPLVEQILQGQLNNSLASLGMSLGGQIIPPVLFRSEPDSYALIVSPRDEIRQTANLMLVRNLTLEEIIQLEEAIEGELDLSALVVGIGGVGLYPAMIIESGNLDWLIHVIAHEWTHNYLTIRPLGVNYLSSPELTTINETIADLSADEIQAQTYRLYYPAYIVPESESESSTPLEIGENDESSTPEIQDQPQIEKPFDFRAEMHITRLEADRLLELGEINAAEVYMESRRIFFWDNGYQIRKLNQAYFAFHGSYAADPGGAADKAGADLGSQLRKLKDNQPSYAAFMRIVAWRWRLDQFQDLFQELK